MKKVIESFHRYRYLLVISLCSAVLVVVVQTLAHALFPQNPQDASHIYLEEATGEIIPMTQQLSTEQFISTFQAAELKEFQGSDQLEDVSILQNVKKIEIHLEKLFVSLDDTPLLAKVNLMHSANVNTSVCTTEDQPRKSCAIYLVSKSGKSLPITVTLINALESTLSTIKMQVTKNTEEYEGIFTGQPIQLDIRAM